LIADGTGAVSWTDAGLRIWDLQRGALLHDITSQPTPISDISISEDGRQALTWSSNRLELANCTITLWDIQQGKRLLCLEGHGAPVVRALMFDGCRRALSLSYDRTIRLWDLLESRCLDIIHMDYPPYPLADIALALGGRRVAVGDAGGRVHVIRLQAPNAQA
jgi:WD40 repeat protein